MTPAAEITIPDALLPGDGRFGSGPSKVRPEAVSALSAIATTYLGTSHRRDGVKSVVSRIRTGLTDLYQLPDGWEVVLGNGGTTAFWDAATACLIERRSHHLAFGEFSSRFAGITAKAPHLHDPVVQESEPGTAPTLQITVPIDTLCLTHNETSTGVQADIDVSGAKRPGSVVLVDATSAAGGIDIDLAAAGIDVYYFAPQKVFAADGGLWLALFSPAGLERARRVVADRPGGRWVPDFLDLAAAADNSVKNQTLNTPSLATLFLVAEQLDWILACGGLAWADKRCRQSSDHIYAWAEASAFAQPFVARPEDRSTMNPTIDLDDSVSADDVCAVLRAHGVVDLEGYRKLGRNQLRIACFPAIDPADIEALTASIDHVAARLLVR